MTREEAITYLKVIWNRYKAEYEIERETLDAYHMAIDALKGGDAKMDNCQVQAPQNYMQQSRHDDGRMTREKAVKWVKFVHDVLYEDKDEEIREALNMAIEALSADAVQGEWEKTTDGNGWNEWYVLKCPLCDATIEDKQNRKWEYNYCPNCGARMKGGDTE